VALARLRESSRLRHSLALWSFVGLVTSEGFAIPVALLHGSDSVVPAAAATLVWWLLVTVVVVGGAAMLTTPDGVSVDRYGVPNGLTAIRAWFCVPLLVLATLSLPGRLPLALWGGVGGAVGLLDGVDGLIARRWGRVTALGKALDPFMDSLFFTAGAVGSYFLGILPLWLAALIGFRYFAPVLGTPFVFLAKRRPELVHTVWGRRNTILIGVTFFALYWVRLAGGPVWLAALIIGLPALVPTMLLHFIALGRRVAASPVVGRGPVRPAASQPPG